MTLKGGTSQACAACKYQRKRCTPECALAPHFRPEQTEIFKNAHKLFGVRNILRILEQVEPALKNEAMRSIIYQANMRDRSPVFGCLGVIYQLQYQIRHAEKELYAVVSELELCKQNQRDITLSPPVDSSPESQHLHGLTLFQNDSRHQPVAASFQTDGYNVNSAINIDSKDNNNSNNNLMWGGQQTYYHDKSQVVNVNTQPLMSFQEEVTHDYDEIYPFFDTIDDTQSYIDSKEANESSSESSIKEGNKIKNAQLQLGIMSGDYQTFA
ncbi:hypothetical protein R6Q59_025390 [Mikania micrantha]